MLPFSPLSLGRFTGNTRDRRILEHNWGTRRGEERVASLRHLPDKRSGLLSGN